jgi:hypothetical protein
MSIDPSFGYCAGRNGEDLGQEVLALLGNVLPLLLPSTQIIDGVE